ncbi:MAG: hypothetical protein F6K63_30030 [Moorea sp. SIO1G6]|uniref:hypothetical protein n=1 Tax=Moorena sp. SIO1G6 TaxID=2607840 RepID=UPI0013C16FD7|nr:hypothetical protein [Moorena sp. SIO1G6]NET68409.1 hypothetical protein [Moorena sp. SIO1G6]
MVLGWLIDRKSAKANGSKLMHRVRFTSNYDPDPAMACRKQHQVRLVANLILNTESAPKFL